MRRLMRRLMLGAAWPGSRPLPVGRLAGFPVYLSPAWLLLAALMTVAYGQLLRRAHDVSPGVAGYGLGLAFALCLLVSVLLHELGHALVCRRNGIGVRAITLEMLGGYTEMDRDAPRPGVEFAVALAGPGVSLAVGGLGAGLALVLPDGGPAQQFAAQVAGSNLVIAAFNALPGLPLDGGRVLQAVIWAVGRDPHRGNRVAGRIGHILALSCLLLAGAGYLRGWLAAPVAVLIGVVALTVGSGARQAVRYGRIGARLPLLDAAGLARPIFRVPTGTPLGEAWRRADRAGAVGATLAVADPDGLVVAVVDDKAVAAVPVVRRGAVPVDSVAREVTAVRSIAAGLRGADVLRAVQADPAGEYLVTSGDDVIGVLHAGDVARLLRAETPGGRSGRGRRVNH
jgi:Zn-dependent protease